MNPLPPRRVRVIGAGLAGLSAAYFLQKKGFQVQLLESTHRVGGLIGTQKMKYGIAESGANAFVNSHLLERLCQELDLEMTVAKPLARKNRFLESRGKLTRWPLGFGSTLRFLLGLLFFKFFKPHPFESVARWGNRLLGRTAMEQLLAKVLQGVYVADPANLSASLLTARFYRPCRRTPSPLVRGSVAPLGGMQDFVDRLAASFVKNGGELVYGREVSATDLSQYVLQGEKIVLATPVWQAAALLRDIDAEVASDLSEVPALPLESTTLFWSSADTDALRPGFGALLERDQRLLGVLENDQIFEERVWGEGVLSETWISTGLGDALGAIKAKRKHLGPQNQGDVLDMHVSKWERAIPLYGKKLEFALRKDLSTKVSSRGIHLIGNYMGEIGVSKIVERSFELAERLAKS